jgi:Cu/Ag efflux protein CusF
MAPGRRVVTLILAVAALAAAARLAAAADYRGTGVVVALMPAPSSLHATRPVIIIHHDPLPPLMPEEMDMPFLAASPALLANLRPGDRISFALKDTPDALLVVAIERAVRRPAP